jgi:Ser/Thr protein kinase RdoA (MazF antagonist)
MDSFLPEANSLAKVFLFKGKILSVSPYGNGHINKTFLVESDERYILQRLNPQIFAHSKETMKNLVDVTVYLEKAILAEKKAGRLVKQEPLQLVKTYDRKFAYRAKDGAYWRAFHLRDKSETFEEPTSLNDLYASGVGFGTFLYLLRDYPAAQLFETIPHFHDTPKRFRDFEEAVQLDPKKRKKECANEIAYLEKFSSFYPRLTEALAQGEIPYRVTHNDTKFNNLLFDCRSHEVVSVLDLDTVMEGTPLYDFGDACRSSCNNAEESERDLRKVFFSLEKYKAFSKGYLTGTSDILNAKEKALLSDSVLLLTLELALRFLEDYLRGDVYFAHSQEDDNLARARGQIALAKDIEKKLPEMRQILG